MMPTHPSTVVAGVDTHLATHHVAVLDHTTGALLGDLEIETSLTGYRQLLDFVSGPLRSGRSHWSGSREPRRMGQACPGS